MKKSLFVLSIVAALCSTAASAESVCVTVEGTADNSVVQKLGTAKPEKKVVTDKEAAKLLEKSLTAEEMSDKGAKKSLLVICKKVDSKKS